MKIVRFFYNIVSVCLVLAIIAIAFMSVLLGISGMDRQNPKSIFGFRAFIVLTPSMTPTFDAGSLIIIRETAASGLADGDIITYRPLQQDDALLTHRIVQINENGGNRTFITRGDANNTDDPNEVQPDSILGKTVFHMNELGTFFVNLRTPVGIGIMVGILVLGLFIIPALIAPRTAKNKTDALQFVYNSEESEEIDGDGEKTEKENEKPTIEDNDDEKSK